MKKITSADSSDLLGSNMAAQLSTWPIRIYFPNPGKCNDETGKCMGSNAIFDSRILRSNI